MEFQAKIIKENTKNKLRKFSANFELQLQIEVSSKYFAEFFYAPWLPLTPLSSLIYDCTFLRLGYVTILSY